MITEYQYLKAKKVVADYESQQLNKPDVIGIKTPKRRVKKRDMKKLVCRMGQSDKKYVALIKLLT